MYIVRVTSKATCQDYFLRGSIWTNEIERAQKFPTKELAEAQFRRAMTFTKPRVFKAQFGEPVYDQR